MDKITVSDLKALMLRLGEVMTAEKERLCQLDAEIGDGDLGLTMSKGFNGTAQAVQSMEEPDIGKLLMKAGMQLNAIVPSTMGTLMSTGLMQGGKAIVGTEAIGAREYAVFLDAFSKGLMKRGKAELGDKTIIDAMEPAARKAEETAELSLKECTAAAAAGGEDGVENTKSMVSKHGKAAVFREKTIGKPDPGAIVALLFLKTIADFVA